MNLDDIVIVLARPQDSMNIGAVCRAMANFGQTHLRIVTKDSSKQFNEEKISLLAIHAFPIWQNAHFFSSITQATQDCSLSIATTRRKGKKRGILYTPKEAISFLQNQKDGKTAFVFGNERTGLCDCEIAQCNIALTIPSSSSFASLNLSHAVQIVCYEIYKAFLKQENLFQGVNSISTELMQELAKEIAQDLKKIGFFTQTKSTYMEHFFQSIFSRAALTKGEADYIKKIFKKASSLVQKKQNDFLVP